VAGGPPSTLHPPSDIPTSNELRHFSHSNSSTIESALATLNSTHLHDALQVSKNVLFHDSVLTHVAEEMDHWWSVENLPGQVEGLVEAVRFLLLRSIEQARALQGPRSRNDIYIVLAPRAVWTCNIRFIADCPVSSAPMSVSPAAARLFWPRPFLASTMNPTCCFRCCVGNSKSGTGAWGRLNVRLC
jgi:hypothetical protein